MKIKIGVFDSGVGGITVLTELREKFASFDFVYVGDTANVPYGVKSPAQIRKFSIQCAKILKKEKVDVLVVACNTAASWALESIRKEMGSVPVFGVVEPGAKAAWMSWEEKFEEMKIEQPQNHSEVYGKIPLLVLATRATVQSHSYLKALKKGVPKAVSKNSNHKKIKLVEQACPLLVPMIEEGWVDHPILYQTISEYVKPLKTASTGVALLGCTHYPWIHSAIEKCLPGWKVVNSAYAIGQAFEKMEVFKRDSDRSEGSRKKGKVSKKGKIKWIFTDPDSVPLFAKHWMKHLEGK